MNNPIDPKVIHPDLEPIDKAPSLFSFYGFGLRLFGNRDYSKETNSAIKTLFITLLFIPVFPLKAYRVITNGKQYHFLGRVPISSIARNAGFGITGLLLSSIAFMGYQQHINSDKYLGKTLLAEAETAFAENDYSSALNKYKLLHRNHSSYQESALMGYKRIMSLEILSQQDNSQLATLIEIAKNFNQSPLKNDPSAIYNLALERINAKNNKDLVGTHSLLHASRDLKKEGESFEELDLKLITEINQTSPNNLSIASELAEHYFAQENLVATKNVLEPVRDQLGSSEGARILGQIYVSEGNNQAAYPLLEQYTSTRLLALQKAEENITNIQNKIWDAQLSQLQNGNGPESFYNEYDALSNEAEKNALLNEYIGEKINNDFTYQNSLDEYTKASAIVPVVLDFGILQLRQAETMSSETERNRELQAAEKTFLSIRSSIGDTDEYRIYLGQVYFWLGKQTEGQELFDQIVTANSRSANSLLNVGYTLRALGKVGLAEEYAGEAYDKAIDKNTKYQAASLMRLLSSSIEDKIEWLQKSDLSSPANQASLKESKGILEERKGNIKAASKLYNEAIQHSESLPENASNYNNTALIYFSLHRVSGDKKDFKKGVDLMSKAVEMRPDESILLSNSASTLITNALYESLDDSINYAAISIQPNLSNAGFHYRNNSEKVVLIEKLNKHPDFIKAIDQYNRSILLSPNNVSNYSELLSIYYFQRDANAIKSLKEKFKTNKVDLSASNKNILEYIAGEDKDLIISTSKDQIKFYQNLLKTNTFNKKTKAVIYAEIADNQINLVQQGETENIKSALENAENAYSIYPSADSEEMLTTALLTKASIDLAELDSNYKKVRGDTVISVSDEKLLVLALQKDPEISALMADNKSLIKANQLNTQSIKDFPESTNISSWALFSTGTNSAKEKIEKNIRDLEYRRETQDLHEKMYPLSSGTYINSVWFAEILNTPNKVMDKNIFIDNEIKLPDVYLK